MKTKTTKTKTKVAKPTAAQKQARSMAAYKAHLTRQTQILKATKSRSVKAEAREAIKAITANMKAA